MENVGTKTVETVNGQINRRKVMTANERVSIVVKRGIDITFAFLLLIFGLPIFLLVAGLVFLDSSGLVFYQQSRVGLGE